MERLRDVFAGLALAGVDVPDRFPAVWWLHMGLCVVFPPVRTLTAGEDASDQATLVRMFSGHWLFFYFLPFAFFAFATSVTPPIAAPDAGRPAP